MRARRGCAHRGCAHRGRRASRRQDALDRPRLRPGLPRLRSGTGRRGTGTPQPGTGQLQLAIRHRLEGRRGIQRTGLPEPVTAGRDRGIADDPHLSDVRAGEPGTVRGDLLLVHLGRARVNQVDVHQLAERAEVTRVQPQLDRVRREQRATRGYHEHIGQVTQAQLQNFLPVAPRAAAHPLHPRMGRADPHGPQRQHAPGAERRDEQQELSTGNDRPGRWRAPPPSRRPRPPPPPSACGSASASGHGAGGAWPPRDQSSHTVLARCTARAAVL